MSRMSELLMTRPDNPSTSHEAARRVIPHLTDIQEKVLLFLYNSPKGATDLDIQRFFEDDRSTYRTRRAELVRLGRVKDSGRRVKQDGFRRVVWEWVY